MNEKRMEEWYNKFLKVMDFFKKNPKISASVHVQALETGSYSFNLSIHVWNNDRDINTSHYVDVKSYSEMDENSKKAWAAIKRLMK